MIVLGLISMSFFLIWFFQPEHKGFSILYWLLTIAMLFKMLRWLHEWYHYFSISYPKAPELKKHWTVDMLTTFCPGEPYEMVVDTLKAMVAVKYPHTTYLCDEGDDDYLKNVCAELGVVHVTRKEKINAKAGNINNALKQATGEICVVLDPDHQPYPEFLDAVLPHFENPKIGFVQVVQAYGNQGESLVAQGAAEQTYHFYGPMMMGMSSYGTAQAIGANCTFRRTALDSIGGHAAGLSEDMHTAMQLHAKGWKSVYLPEVLTRGLVPATLSAYYQQQLKWSRGTFELLFTTYPKLFRHFTWRQKLHYFLIPLHFLSGMVTVIDILIPVLALLLAEPVWKINLGEFAKMFLPLLILTLIIRQYAQRWLIEPHERGMHLAGGLLKMGTWWIFLIGLFCTIFRVKIPYIPTPKNDEPRNDWKLGLPNIIAAVISFAAIPIGLLLDFTPFTFFIASFALVNALALTFAVIMGQQKVIIALKQRFWRTQMLKKTYFKMESLFVEHYLNSLTFFRRSAIVLAFFLSVFAFSYEYREFFHGDKNPLEGLEPPKEKDAGGFYAGIYVPDVEKKNSFTKLDETAKQLSTTFDIVSIYMAWGPESGAEFPDTLMREIIRRNAVPMLTWEPWTWPFPEYRDHPDLCCEKKVLQYITQGYFDKYLADYAVRLKSLKAPVMVRFAHEFDNLAYPWSEAGGNSPQDFIDSWRYIVHFFDSMAVGNVTWVWNPWEEENLQLYYPGASYVDWIGVTNLNYGLAASNNTWYPFEDLYKPFSDKIKQYNKPVMLSEFGSTTFGGNQKEWLSNAFHKIKTEYTEIKSIVFFYSDADPNWGFTDWRPADGSKTINWTFTPDAFTAVKHHLSDGYFQNNLLFSEGFTFKSADKNIPAGKSYLAGGQNNFQLMEEGKPFYIKGVVYNAGHDWRDGDVPLTRSKLEDDFKKIKAMGANTIRRYEPSIYDYNIFNAARANDLKVIYGFWFENKVDYVHDEKILMEYAAKVEEKVKQYRNEPALLGWCIGNEVWGLLKQYYGQPYRYRVREKYVEFIEHLAQRIHEIDPTRPVFISEEHTSQLPAAIESFRDGAPSVDVVGVNSYYRKHIRKLQQEMATYNPERPYLVSEFGPEGYWQTDFTPHDEYGGVLEAGGVEKAKLYVERWNEHILPHQGSNVGGIAYCWSDRLEGTATWFGMTDHKGRLKPVYCALKNTWTGSPCKKDESVKETYIFAPVASLEPGEEYLFFAVTENFHSAPLEFEWYLSEDELIQMKTPVKTLDGGRQAIVQVPMKPSNYRLYLNVSNNKGYCNTASYPIKAYRHW